MKVLKFGGTSVGSALRMKGVAKIICDGERKVVVLSAMSGTTNCLVRYSEALYKGEHKKALEIINELEEKYFGIIDELYKDEIVKDDAQDMVKSHFNYMRSFLDSEFTPFEEKAILSQGELLSTALFQFYLHEIKANSVLIPALEFMRINQAEEPDTNYLAKHLTRILASYPDKEIYLTQGFICRNLYGEIDNLKRGGSDYSASLIGAAIHAEEIQIWTDIDGMRNNDPRYVEKTKPVRLLNFNEAAELAYFGAKILHPTCILPARINDIPVRLLNTMEPSAQGTLISNKSEQGIVKAVAAKDGITAIKIKSGRMLLAYGFLRKVFEIFEAYQTPIDVITTSEVGVSVTIDDCRNLDKIAADLQKFGDVTIDEKMVIICVVGDLEPENIGINSRVMQAMKQIPIRMISYGGSNYNISFIIPEEYKEQALNALSNLLFS